MTPGPWRWWTSNSHARPSSDATGKDGDVISAVRARDGLPVISVHEEDMPVLAASRALIVAWNAVPAETRELVLALAPSWVADSIDTLK